MGTVPVEAAHRPTHSNEAIYNQISRFTSSTNLIDKSENAKYYISAVWKRNKFIFLQ